MNPKAQAVSLQPGDFASPVVDLNAVIAHLRFIDSKGYHQLSAIHPQTGAIVSKTFGPIDESEAAVRAWASRFGMDHGLYYLANEPRPDLGEKRASKSDIVNIRAVWIDLDPDERGVQTHGLGYERKRLLEIVEELRGEPEHFPSAVIDSGGGLQILWRLSPKLPAAEFQAQAEEQTRGLTLAYGADSSATDVSRLLRLPGTINLPSRKKRLKGRTKATQARAIEYDEGGDTKLEELATFCAPVPQTKSSSKLANAVDVDQSALESVLEQSDLPEELTSRFFGQLCGGNEAICRLWNGDRTAAPGSDESGSGYAFALALLLRPTGLVTATEFGMLLRVWEHSSVDKDKIDARYVSRAWAKAQAAASEEFAPSSEGLDKSALSLADEFTLKWVTPFQAIDIPTRQWVLGRFLAKQYLSGLISPPGVGKTTFLLMLAVAVASGRDDITGFKVHKRTRVLIWNQEDDMAELQRRLLAVMTAFDVSWEDIQIDGRPGILLGSGVDKGLMVASRTGDDSFRPSRDIRRLEQMIQDEGIGVAIFDPFVELHPADENSNVQVASVARIMRGIAVRTASAVAIAHHTRKPSAADATSHAGNMDSARGAGALNGVARMVATLYTLDAATGKRFGVSEDECRLYVRFDDAKNNLGLVSAEPKFYRREGVAIGGFGGEEVGVLRPVALDRKVDAKDQARASLVQDVFDCMPSSGKITVPEMARELAKLPMRTGEKPRSIETTIRRVFAEPVQHGSREIALVVTSVGRPVLQLKACDSDIATGASAIVAGGEK